MTNSSACAVDWQAVDVQHANTDNPAVSFSNLAIFTLLAPPYMLTHNFFEEQMLHLQAVIR